MKGIDAEILLAHVLGVSRTYLRTWPEQTLTEAQKQVFESLMARRLAGEPVAYLTGTKEFWSLPLVVSKDVLIPRPETECLVQLVLDNFKKDSQNIRVLDLGTGSGAIALALATERPCWKITAIDRSVAALEIGSRNAKNLKITNVEFVISDWFSSFMPDETQFDIIVGNPPYIDPQDEHLLGEIRYEPQEALVSAPDGLGDLKTIITQASRYLTSKGWLFLEHGFDQAAFVRKTLESCGFAGVITHPDLAQLDRVTFGHQIF